MFTRGKILLLLCTILLSQHSFSMDPTLPQPVDFDLYLLVGQSNMAGRGIPTEEDGKPVPRVLVFDKEGQWASRGEPIHFDKPEVAGVGLGFTFGKLMAEKYPAKNIGLIPCAVGGTPISRWKPGADLFESDVTRAKLAMKTGVLKGILWHQGEASSGDEARARIYAAELAEVINGFRKALDLPDVPVVVGELGEFLSTRTNGKSPFAVVVNQQIDTIPSLVPNTIVVSSKGLHHKGDEVHFDADSQREFGRRYFEKFLLLEGKSAAP